MLTNVTRRGLVQKVMVLYIIVWSVSPPLQVDLIYRLAALGAVGVWGIEAMRRGYYVEKQHVYAVIFAVAVVIIAYFEKGSFDAIMKQIPYYILVVCFLINCFYRDKWEELKGIVPLVLILMIIFNWKTGTVLMEDPTIARKLVRADEATYEYLRQGVGGYSLIYPQVCIFPAIFAWIKKVFRHNRKYFVMGCVYLVAYFRCLMNAGYAIAVFASILGIIILLFYKGKDVTKAIIASVTFFILGLAAIIYVDWFREFLLVQFDGTAIARKINDLVDSTREGSPEGAIYDRIVSYRGSWDTIKEYPLLGGLWRAGGGGHSAVLDAFAKFGILGGCLYTKMIFHVPFYYKKKETAKYFWPIANAAIVSIMFISILDSFNYSFMGMILIVLPLLFEDIREWENA